MVQHVHAALDGTLARCSFSEYIGLNRRPCHGTAFL